jgi:hypothetical protein
MHGSAAVDYNCLCLKLIRQASGVLLWMVAIVPIIERFFCERRMKNGSNNEIYGDSGNSCGLYGGGGK